MGGADKGEFEELLRPHLRVAPRLAFGLLQDRVEAEDAVQEAALKAWRRFETFRGGAFRPWFLGIVANQCRTVRRGRWWNVIRLAQPEAPQLSPDPVRGADLRRALVELRRGARGGPAKDLSPPLPPTPTPPPPPPPPPPAQPPPTPAPPRPATRRDRHRPRPHDSRRQIPNQPRPAAAEAASCLRGGGP